MQLIDALVKGINVIFVNHVSFTRPTVIALGLTAVFSFFIGLYVFFRKIPKISFEGYKSFFMSIDVHRIFWLYVFIDIGLLVAGKIIWLMPGFVQPLYVFVLFKWSLFYLLVSTVFFQKRYKMFLFLLILFDVVVGFFSFFSTFKEVIYFTFLSYWVFFVRSSFFAKTVGVFLIFLTFYFGIVWTAIKVDYRNFLNQGTGAQAILVSRNQAYAKLFDLATNVSSSELERGFDELVDRLSWIGAFDGVYKYVPRKRPHENGKLWSEAIGRPFMPRLFFPSKKALEDSKELNYYSGLNVDEKHTSISLSMIAASYVDFGIWRMHLPLFLFGLFCGWIYKRAFEWGRYLPIGYALTMPTIYLFHIAEESVNRIVSFIVLYFLLLWFIKRFLIGRFMNYIAPGKNP